MNGRVDWVGESGCGECELADGGFDWILDLVTIVARFFLYVIRAIMVDRYGRGV